MQLLDTTTIPGLGALAGRVRVDVGAVTLEGELDVPSGAQGVVVFFHGCDAGPTGPDARFAAQTFLATGLAVLHMDLLTAEERAVDDFTFHLRFDLGLLAQRLAVVTDWLTADPRSGHLPVGYYGVGTESGVALLAAGQRRDRVGAVVLHGGRPDLAGECLAEVWAPTLLLLDSEDEAVIRRITRGLAHLPTPMKRLVILSGAANPGEEPGPPESPARLAAEWFARHLLCRRPQPGGP